MVSGDKGVLFFGDSGYVRHIGSSENDNHTLVSLLDFVYT